MKKFIPAYQEQNWDIDKKGHYFTKPVKFVGYVEIEDNKATLINLEGKN